MVAEFELACDPQSTEIGRQFAQLQRVMIENRTVLSRDEGAKSINRSKNRYKDILPYDKYRVVLEPNHGSDYINASFVEDFNGHRRYIAAQGPIDTTMIDFFAMIWNFQITSIVCLAQDTEAGRMKYRRYWPNGDESLQHGPYCIAKDVASDKSFSCRNYQVRPLTISRRDTQRHVTLYHFLNWLDHDVPNDAASILEFIQLINDRHNSSRDSPLLVHCSAGCGRTGSFIVIDLCRLLFNNKDAFFGNVYQPYPIFTITSYIRQFRTPLIQTPKQYLFVHKMLIFMIKQDDDNLLSSVVENAISTNLPSHSRSKDTFVVPSPPCHRNTLHCITSRKTSTRRPLSDATQVPRRASFQETSAKLSTLLSHNEAQQTIEPPPPIPPRIPLKKKSTERRIDHGENSNNTVFVPKAVHVQPRRSRRKHLMLLNCIRSKSADNYLMSSHKPHVRHFKQQEVFSD